MNAFRVMDPNRRGYVLAEDLVNFEGTKFSELFIRTVFETVVTPNDENQLCMDLTQFADFVLAWRDRSSKAAVSYFFDVFDVNRKGYLDRVDIHTFFREVRFQPFTFWTKLRFRFVKCGLFQKMKAGTTKIFVRTS